MNLYDPNRPTIAHKRAFVGGMLPIPHIEIWPLEDLFYELSIMLPIRESSGFMAKRFSVKFIGVGLLNWLDQFKNNPEKTIMDTWGQNNNFKPYLNFKKSEPLENLNELLNDL
jgi:hypothetical protein